MSKFEKFWRNFFIYFFSIIAVIIITVGIYRIKNAPGTGDVPTPTPPEPSPNQSTGGSTLSFTGKTIQTPYGSVAAAIQVKNGKIVAVTIPILPNSEPSHYAQPLLIDQALKAGSANIQGVSGATYTTNAFKTSLENAISQSQTKSTGAQAPVTIETPSGSVTKAPAATPPPTTSSNALAFVGKTFTTRYGATSVEIKVQGGKITDVTTPRIPNSEPSHYAQPILIAEALKAGSANIQGVSGATYTSGAFKSSLEDAIAQSSAGANTSTGASAPAIPRSFSDDN